MGLRYLRYSLTAVALAAAHHFALAADYPTRPIRYIVGFAPGGINDLLARIVAQKLNDSWGQPVIVDNRPGAGGNLAAGIVAPAKTPRATVDRIAGEVTRIIRSPEISKRLVEQAVDPMGGTPEEFGKLIREETARFGIAVKASGARAD